MWQLRETVDKTLCDSISKILGLRIVGQIQKRQDGNRIDLGRTGLAKKTVSPATHGQPAQKQRDEKCPHQREILPVRAEHLRVRNSNWDDSTGGICITFQAMQIRSHV